jgi:hypothetical protein
VEGCCEHGNEPLVSMICWGLLSGNITGGFSTRAELHEVSWVVKLGGTSIYPCPSKDYDTCICITPFTFQFLKTVSA